MAGRLFFLAGWRPPYSFSFFLVAGLTLSYFKYLEDQTASRWAAFLFFCVFLIWTSYFGWAILACLAIDQVLRWRAKEPSGTPKVLLGTAALLFVSFLPLFPAFRSDLSNGMNLHQAALTILANAGFHVFSLFVSESVAPWYWRLSIPAGLAVLLSLGLVAWWVRGPARRLLFYSLAILAAMALLGILQTQYLFMLSPWVLLPVGVAIDAAKPRWATFALAAALLIDRGSRVVRNLFAALLFRASIHRTLAGSGAGCGRENQRRRNRDLRPSFISFLSHLSPPRTQPKRAVEIRGLTSRFSQASSGLFPGRLACRGASNERENDPGSTRGRFRRRQTHGRCGAAIGSVLRIHIDSAQGA